MKEGIIEDRPEFWGDEPGKPYFGVPEMFTDTCVCPVKWFDAPQEAYAALIDKINGKGTWDSNPYMWVYDYELTSEKP